MKNVNLAVLHLAKKLLSYRYLVSLALFLFASCAFAHGSQSLGDIAHNISKSMTGLARLITAASYVAGIAFAMMGMLKLKAHKDNPTQVPLGQPIVLLIISVGLVFLPNLINTGGATVWGDQARHAEARANHFDLDHLG